MAIFGPKPWLNPLAKKSNFRLFEDLVFIVQKSVFFVLEYRKTHFPGLYCPKKKVGKMAIFGPKPWINPFENMSIFRLYEFLGFIVQKDVFSFQNIVKNSFSWPILAKKEVGKNGHFQTKKRPKLYVKTFAKMSIFRLFELLVFIVQKGVFFVLEYRKTLFSGLYRLKKIQKNGHFWTKTIG